MIRSKLLRNTLILTTNEQFDAFQDFMNSKGLFNYWDYAVDYIWGDTLPKRVITLYDSAKKYNAYAVMRFK